MQTQNWTDEEKCRELSQRLTGKATAVITQLTRAGIRAGKFQESR